MHISYTLPIIETDKENIIATLQQHKDTYDFLEIWLDYIEDLDISFIQTLMNSYEKQLIFVFRRKCLEKTQLHLTLTKQILNTLHQSQVLVDLDIKKQKALITYIHKRNLAIKLILSYHNYDVTPPTQLLKNVIIQMETYTPYIYKISTFCQTQHDCVRLLDILIQLKKQKKRCIILGMGQNGMATRIFGTVWGNEMIFAPLHKQNESAPGQLTKENIQQIIDILL